MEAILPIIANSVIECLGIHPDYRANQIATVNRIWCIKWRRAKRRFVLDGLNELINSLEMQRRTAIQAYLDHRASNGRVGELHQLVQACAQTLHFLDIVATLRNIREYV